MDAPFKRPRNMPDRYEGIFFCSIYALKGGTHRVASLSEFRNNLRTGTVKQMPNVRIRGLFGKSTSQWFIGQDIHCVTSKAMEIVLISG